MAQSFSDSGMLLNFLCPRSKSCRQKKNNNRRAKGNGYRLEYGNNCKIIDKNVNLNLVTQSWIHSEKQHVVCHRLDERWPRG